MGIPCFWLAETNILRRALRRFSGSNSGCPRIPGVDTYHDARVWIDTVPATFKIVHGRRCVSNSYEAAEFRNDPRWPKVCECGAAFTTADAYDVWTELLYHRTDTGESVTLRDAPPGAMWDATWMPHQYRGPDGRSLHVRLPDGSDWCIDGPCSNCTRPREKHQCWVRHGEPPMVTVDKNGDTCAAGAGSIQTERWHGFLREGQLVPA